jgi:hypothetical protein
MPRPEGSSRRRSSTSKKRKVFVTQDELPRIVPFTLIAFFAMASLAFSQDQRVDINPFFGYTFGDGATENVEMGFLSNWQDSNLEVEATTTTELTRMPVSNDHAVFASAQSSASDEWEFALTPFLWAPGMDGTVGLAGRELDFEVSASDLLENLDFGFMTNFEARKARWSVGVDYFYADLGKDVTVENVNLAERNPRLDMNMTIVEGDVGYEVASSLDVLGGIRRVSASAGLLTDQGTLADVDGGFTDPIVGARFRRDLTEKLWVNVRGDVGGFGAGSDFSWFLSASGGVRVSKLLSLGFGYRIWDFDYESADDLKRLDMALGGFGGGVTFHF